jgi:hypothetical protein
MVTASVNTDGLSSPFEQYPDILVEMGRVVSVWGSVSHLLRTLLSRLLDCDPLEADTILMGFAGEEKRLEFMISLFKTKPEDAEREQFVAALEGIKKLCGDRNLIVHGGPVHGGKKDVRPRDNYFVNFKKRDEATRYVAAAPHLAQHLTKLRDKGSTLFDLMYPDDPSDPDPATKPQ